MGKSPVLLGLGVSILGDDGVGLKLAEILREELEEKGIKVEESGEYGIGLLEYFSEHDPIFIVDSLFTDDVSKIGSMEVLEFVASNVIAGNMNAHRVDVPSLILLASSLGQKKIPKVHFFGININIIQQFSEELSQEIEKKLPEYRDIIIKKIKELI